MGILTAALSAGSLIGSFGAGFFADHQMMFLAIVFPSIFLMIGIPLIYMNLPNCRHIHPNLIFLAFIAKRSVDDIVFSVELCWTADFPQPANLGRNHQWNRLLCSLYLC